MELQEPPVLVEAAQGQRLLGRVEDRRFWQEMEARERWQTQPRFAPLLHQGSQRIGRSLLYPPALTLRLRVCEGADLVDCSGLWLRGVVVVVEMLKVAPF